LEQNNMDEAKKMIEDAATIMEDLVGADAVVHASYYKASCQYYKLKGPADAFFSKAIMLLAYVPMEAMSKAEAYTLAQDVGLAALAGDKCYNFGEVVRPPAPPPPPPLPAPQNIMCPLRQPCVDFADHLDHC
jgi:26S proteasome regulatory subunit N9